MTSSVPPQPPKAVAALHRLIAKHLSGADPQRTAEVYADKVSNVIQRTNDQTIITPLLECLSAHAADPNLSMTLKWGVLTNLALVPQAFNTWLHHLPEADLDAHMNIAPNAADNNVNLWFLLSLNPSPIISFQSLLRTPSLRAHCLKSLSSGHWLTEPPRINPDEAVAELHQLTNAIRAGGPTWINAFHHAFKTALHKTLRTHHDLEQLINKGDELSVSFILPQMNVSLENNLKRLDTFATIMSDACDQQLMAKIYDSVAQTSLAQHVDVHCPFLHSQWSRARLAEHLPPSSLSTKSKM